MSSTIIRRVVIFGILCIMGIVGMQLYWVSNTWDLKEQEFDQSVHIALWRVAKEMAELEDTPLPPADLIKRISSNYYVVHTNSIIDAGALENSLLQEFQELSLHIDFEYAIHDCETNEMVYGDFCAASDLPVDETILGFLPKYDQFAYYFGVKFPSRSGYLLSLMQTSVLLSLILLLTILFFIYSIYIILSQKRLSEMQKDFINNMTHEFKTPISTIKISAEVFLGQESIQNDARLLRYANIIKEQNERLNTQVEKVLQIARFERDNFKLHLESIDLHAVLANTIHSIELKVNQEKGTIQSFPTASYAVVKADKLHLTNILYNLLDNAIKYCKDAPEISVKTSMMGAKIRLSISDKGMGIPKEFQHKVFDKFFRVPTGNIHNVKGFGLGLFYIKNICDAHGWKIELESEQEIGTSIHIIMNRITN